MNPAYYTSHGLERAKERIICDESIEELLILLDERRFMPTKPHDFYGRLKKMVYLKRLEAYFEIVQGEDGGIVTLYSISPESRKDYTVLTFRKARSLANKINHFYLDYLPTLKQSFPDDVLRINFQILDERTGSGLYSSKYRILMPLREITVPKNLLSDPLFIDKVNKRKAEIERRKGFQVEYVLVKMHRSQSAIPIIHYHH